MRSRRQGGGRGANKALTSSQQKRGNVTPFLSHRDGPAHLFTWAVGPSKAPFTIMERRDQRRPQGRRRRGTGGGFLNVVMSQNPSLHTNQNLVWMRIVAQLSLCQQSDDWSPTFNDYWLQWQQHMPPSVQESLPKFTPETVTLRKGVNSLKKNDISFNLIYRKLSL